MTLAPSLTLNATLNDPFDDVAVIGFTARDMVYGRNVVVLKGKQLPEVDELRGDSIPLPPTAVKRLDDEGPHDFDVAYVLMDESVFEIDGAVVNEYGRSVPIERNGTEVTFKAVDATEGELYDRDDIEIQ